jgi:hypothetical protein
MHMKKAAAKRLTALSNFQQVRQTMDDVSIDDHITSLCVLFSGTRLALKAYQKSEQNDRFAIDVVKNAAELLIEIHKLFATMNVDADTAHRIILQAESSPKTLHDKIRMQSKTRKLINDLLTK